MTDTPPPTSWSELLAERRQLLAAVDLLDLAVVVVTTSEGIVLCNRRAREQLGFDPTRMGGDVLAAAGHECYHEDGTRWPLEERPHRVAAREGRSFDQEVMELRRGGASRWLQVAAAPLYRDGADRPYAAVATFRDITTQRADRLALVESETHFRLLAENAGDLIARHTPAGICTYASPAARELLGREPASLLGDWTSASPVHPDDVPLVLAGQQRLVAAAEPSLLRYRVQHTDGRWLWVETIGRPVCGSDGEVIEIQSATRDITARIEQEHRLARLALVDALTGLPNRAALTQFLEDQLGARRPLSVLFLDLDRFKVVNDSLGHSAGDDLLRTVAGRLSAACRDGDLVARLGGDEFVLVATGLDEAAAVALADRVLRMLAVPVPVGGHELVISASVGIVQSDPADPDVQADVLLRDADVSMYRAKARGRGRSVVWSAELGAAAVRRFGLESQLRAALERDELVVHYQPQLALDSGRIVGVEALVRWQHPTRGLLAPAEFLAVADESGLVVELGRQVLVSAVRQVGHWRGLAGAEELGLSVNVTAQELLHPGRLEAVLAVLAEAGMPPQSLTLEVLESVLFDPEGAVVAALQECAGSGIRLALDDFGTGSASLLGLRGIPLSALKIDRSFVAGIGVSPQDEAIVRAVRSLTDDLGLGCVAEGVEHELQRSWLAGQGVGFAQGYLLYRPLPAEQLQALLVSRDPAGEPAAGLVDG